MLTRGADITLPGGGVVSLRPITPEDEEFLLAVFASTRADELAYVPWSDEQKAAFVRQQFDAQRREYDARYQDSEYDVILLDARPVGRLWIGRDDKQIRLLDIAILPEAQNRGVGGALVRRLIAEARETGQQLQHMVFIMNTEAQRFYERLGFRVFEEVGAYRHMEWRAEESADAT